MHHYKGNLEKVWFDWSSLLYLTTVLFEHANQFKVLFKI